MNANRIPYARVDVMTIGPDDPTLDQRIAQVRRHVWKTFTVERGDAFGFVYWRGEWYLAEARRDVASGKVFWTIMADCSLDDESVEAAELDTIRKVER